MTQKFFLISLSSIVLFFFICFVVMASVLNSDFGWHMRMGQIILQSGIPHHDPLSYSMPSYYYIDNSWLADIILFQGYNVLGFTPLVLITVLFYLFAIVIQCDLKKKYSLILPLLFTGLLCIPEASVRSQVFSFVFFSLVVKIVCNPKIWKKYKWTLPFICMLWSNLHGGFGIGIVSLGMVVVIHTIQNKKFIREEGLLLLISIIATCINPYGPLIWREQWIHLLSSQLKLYIEEWQPAFINIMWDFWLYLPLSLSIIFIYRKKLLPEEVALYAVMLLAAITSVRNIPLWALIALPITVKALTALYEDSKKVALATKRITILYGILITGVLLGEIIPTAIGMYTLHNTWNEKAYYPASAVIYMQQHPTSGEIFAPLPWTGYLSWHLPEKRIFVDGRMVTWKQKNPPATESSNAFLEYIAILDNKIPVQTLIKKYHIHTFLLSTTITNDPGKRNFISDIIRNNGKIVYKDNNAIMYQTVSKPL